MVSLQNEDCFKEAAVKKRFAETSRNRLGSVDLFFERLQLTIDAHIFRPLMIFLFSNLGVVVVRFNEIRKHLFKKLLSKKIVRHYLKVHGASDDLFSIIKKR